MIFRKSEPLLNIVPMFNSWVSVEDRLPSHTRVVAIEYTNGFIGVSSYDVKWNGLMCDSSGSVLNVARWHDLSDPSKY